jgi:hypothetical protein
MTMVKVGPLGHVNGASSLGDWPQGSALFKAFQEEREWALLCSFASSLVMTLSFPVLTTKAHA